MPAVKQEDRLVQADSELHVGLELPRHSARQIYIWAKQQSWPEGVELEPPSEYHITLLYTPEGHDEHKDAWWINHMEQVQVTINGLKAFPAQEKGYAYVLTIDAPDIKEKAEEMQGRAEAMGLPITHFDGGYKPHITVAYGPSSRLTGIHAPNFQFDVGPSSVSPVRAKKESASWMGFGDDLDNWKDPVPPSIGYHFHAPGNEEYIRHHGIEPTQSLGYMNPLGNGVYMYDYDPRQMHQKNAGDLYQIDLTGLEHELTPDFELEGAWHHPGPIPPERIRRIAGEGRREWTSSKAPEPPNYRHGTEQEHCGNCKMFFKGHCWGYGNVEVDADDTCDSWAPETKRSAYTPEEAQGLNHLSLVNVAANLHYKFEEGGMDPAAATDYAKRMLKLIGYPPDDITVQAALQAWQQMYPNDQLDVNPSQLPTPQVDSHDETAPATVPQKSWGYGTSKVAMPLAESLEPHVTLYHGTTNRALDLARQKGVMEPWHPREVANQVASHYGLDPEEFYHHPYFEFSRDRHEDPHLYATTDPKVAHMYATARSEQLEDALRTAHRMVHSQMYDDAAVEGFSGVPGDRGNQLKAAKDQFRDQYYRDNNIQPQVVQLNVPYSALGDQVTRMTNAGYQPSGSFTLPAPMPLDWMSSNHTSAWEPPRSLWSVDRFGPMPQDRERTLNWQPGSSGKGAIIRGVPHTWNTENLGGSPHHLQYLRTMTEDTDVPNSSDWITIGHGGHYTDNAYDPEAGGNVQDPTAFARNQPGMRYVPDKDKWINKTYGASPYSQPEKFSYTSGDLTYSFDHTGGETLPQEQRRWEGISAPAIHTFPDNWAVHQIAHEDDMHSVGRFMRNCWQNGMGNQDWIDRKAGYGQQPYSLHDENGLPRAAFWIDHQGSGTPMGLFGMRNQPPPTGTYKRLYTDWLGKPTPYETWQQEQQALDPDLRGIVGEPRPAFGAYRAEDSNLASTPLPRSNERASGQHPEGWFQSGFQEPYAFRQYETRDPSYSARVSEIHQGVKSEATLQEERETEAFKQRLEEEEDRSSTVPTQVHNPEDHWPTYKDPSEKPHDIQFSNDWNFRDSKVAEIAEQAQTSSLRAMNHTGQIPGDENYMGNLEIAGRNPHEGANPSYKGAVEGNPVYVKPEGDFHADDLAKERAAFVVGRTMGVRMPHTVVRKMRPQDPMSPVAQVSHDVGGRSLMSSTMAHSFVDQYPEDARHMALFDSVIGNADRHMGNVVRGDDGQIYAIDHGMSFQPHWSPTYNGHTHMLQGEPLTSDETQRLQEVYERSASPWLTPIGISEQQQMAMRARVGQMLDTGAFLTTKYVIDYGHAHTDN